MKTLVTFIYLRIQGFTTFFHEAVNPLKVTVLSERNLTSIKVPVDLIVLFTAPVPQVRGNNKGAFVVAPSKIWM